MASREMLLLALNPGMVLINGKTYQVKVAQKLAFAPGTVVIVDIAYMDYMLYLQRTSKRM